jgi:hypothetical protein
MNDDLEGSTHDLTEVFFRQLRGQTDENYEPPPPPSQESPIAAEITTGHMQNISIERCRLS